MNEGLHFELALASGGDRQQRRSLGAAAASCLCNAVGGGAYILWPGDIMLGDTLAARVTYTLREDDVLLVFDADAAHAAPTLEADVTAALAERAAGFPENNAALIQEYCDRCRTLMKFVDTTYRGMPVYGFAFAVDKFGGLMVMTQESRTVVTIYSGRAELAKDEPQQPDVPLMPRV